MSLKLNKCQVFPNPLLLFIYFLTVPHINSETIPNSPLYQCCLLLSETVSQIKLWCCYSSSLLQHWVRGEGEGGGGPDLFLQSKPFQNSRNFSRNWLGLNNLCEILWLPNVSLIWQFGFFGPNLPRKSISHLKLRNCTFACVQGCYLLYQTLPHGGQQTQRYFNVSSFSSRRDS